MINKEIRIGKFKKCDPQIQNLYVSMELAIILKKLSVKMEAEDQSSFVNIVGDTILGFHKTTDMPQLFQQKLGVSADESQKMASELTEFLAPVAAREAREAYAKKDGLEKLQETFAQPSAPLPPDIGHTENVKQIRTMEGDINRIHGYGAYREEVGDDEVTVASSQEDILSKETPPK